MLLTPCRLKNCSISGVVGLRWQPTYIFIGCGEALGVDAASAALDFVDGALPAAAVTAGSAPSTKSSAADAASTPSASPQPMKMYVGCQRSPTTPEMLQFFKRHGVNNICGYPPDPGPRGHWLVEDLQKTRDLCEKHGVTLDMVALPFLTSSHIDREKR